LLEGQLYLPQVWFSSEYEGRRNSCKIPPQIQFATKTQIAYQLLQRQQGRGILHAGWVGCDSFFGVDSGFRDQLAAMGNNYLAAINPKSKVWLGQRSLTVAELASEANIEWQQVILAEGAKGPIAADVARMRVRDNRDRKPGIEQWLIFRRLADGRFKYYLSNASPHVGERTLWDALLKRWPIEQCFEDGKKHLGMDHYENRSWKGWHRHMTYVSLAMLFLLRLRLRFKKNSNADPASGSASAGQLPRPTEAGQTGCPRDPQVLQPPQLCRLLLPSQDRPQAAAQDPALLRSLPAPDILSGPSNGPTRDSPADRSPYARH
jgi:SRSO17 transposase